MITPNWIALDWGTSHLRAYPMGGNGAVLGDAALGKGMAQLAPDQFEAELLACIGAWAWQGVEILACGMIGARQGWCEAPYLPMPCAPFDGQSWVTPQVARDGLALRILPGLCQKDPADVMRGEETQIAGFLAGEPTFDGLICLPGTHTKWVEVKAGQITWFRTAMIGEVFALLRDRSVLHHAIDGQAMDMASFDDAVNEVAAGGDVMGKLFSIRAESLLGDRVDGTGLGRLSGVLIGADVADMRDKWAERDVAIIGEAALCGLYDRAMRQLGGSARLEDGTGMVLNGLRAAREVMRNG